MADRTKIFELSLTSGVSSSLSSVVLAIFFVTTPLTFGVDVYAVCSCPFRAISPLSKLFGETIAVPNAVLMADFLYPTELHRINGENSFSSVS